MAFVLGFARRCFAAYSSNTFERSFKLTFLRAGAAGVWLVTQQYAMTR